MHLALMAEEPVHALTCLPAAPGMTVHLEFVNSIYRARVRETFTLHPRDGLVLVQVESPSAGVFEYYGFQTDGSGKASVHRVMNEIRLRSHDYANHLLIVGDREIHLRGLVENGKSLIIRVGNGKKCPP